MSSVRVAIVGVGNCAASLVQGVEYYRDADPSSRVPGLMHVRFGDHHVRDLTFVAAFDVDAKKVGQDLAEAILASENNIKIADVPPTGVIVQRGHTYDGLGKYYREMITESDEEPIDVVSTLRVQADVLVCYLGRLGAGGEVLRAVRDRCRRGVRQRVAGVHRRDAGMGTAVRGGRRPHPRRRHQVAGRRNDHTSRAGKALRGRGVVLDRTMQLNVGGNMDFMNMLERERLESKKISKTQAVTSQIDRDLGKNNVHIGPSDYVAWLDDRKWAYVRLEGRAFEGRAAQSGVQAGGVGLAELGRRHHRRRPRRQDREGSRHRRTHPVGVGVFHEVASVQYFDDAARDAVEAFIRGEVDR